MKILFAWSGLTGYMGDCWRELAKVPDVELKVSVDTAGSLGGGRFKPDDVMHGLDWSNQLPPEDWMPDVVFTVGWHNTLCRDAAHRVWGAQTRKVCCFDMPWEWRLRKIAARFVLWRYLHRFDAAFVPGKTAAQYARWLGFEYSRIYTGLFSTNLRRFGERGGCNGFLYVGREAPEKGLDILRAAHARYQARGGKWPLRIVNGVSPDELGAVYASADCFVLASRHEPWGVVLVEAAAAGLPIICTDVCGARHEVVKGNGIVVKAGSVDELAEAMGRVSRVERVEREEGEDEVSRVERVEREEGEDEVSRVERVEREERGEDVNRVEREESGGMKECVDGELGRELAKPYSCEAWAARVLNICEELMR